jgi:ribosomal protein L11 methyltransferase
MTKTPQTQFYEVVFSGSEADIFALAEAVGFEDEIDTLALSIYEGEGKDSGTYFLQSLYTELSLAERISEKYSQRANIQSKIELTQDRDWVSFTQSGLPPVPAGPYFIYGSHDAGNIPSSAKYPILIDAGMAFGTGHHGTTKACLLMLADLAAKGFTPSSVLDLGSGAGILAIAAAKTYHCPILATDIDPDAVEVAIFNAQANDTAEYITALHADGFEHDALSGQTFELIFANILAGPLMDLAPDITRALAPNGHVILSGIIDDMAPAVARAFQAQGLNINVQPSLEGWTSLLGKKLQK